MKRTEEYTKDFPWHFQQRYAGHDVLEVSLEWTYGAITFLTGR